jgi:hypothetical protein
MAAAPSQRSRLKMAMPRQGDGGLFPVVFMIGFTENYNVLLP